MKSFKFFFFLALSLSFWGCQKKDSGPQDVIASYVKYLFQNDSIDKEEVEKYLHGDLLISYKSLTEKQVNELALKSKLKLRKIRFTTAECEEKTSCLIQYVISYLYLKGETKGTIADVKKEAVIDYISGTWKISSVKNLKTFYEMKEPIRF